MTTPPATLADKVGGILTPDNQIVTPAGDLIYCNFVGRVKLARTGLPVLDLGPWTDPDAVVAAWREAVAS